MLECKLDSDIFSYLFLLAAAVTHNYLKEAFLKCIWNLSWDFDGEARIKGLVETIAGCLNHFFSNNVMENGHGSQFAVIEGSFRECSKNFFSRFCSESLRRNGVTAKSMVNSVRTGGGWVSFLCFCWLLSHMNRKEMRWKFQIYDFRFSLIWNITYNKH